MTTASLNFKLWPKQLLALQSPANELLYGGAAGPGKSHLLRVAFITWAFEIPGLQLFLFRRHYRDLIQGHIEGPTGFKALLHPAVEAGVCEIVGLEIRFRNGLEGSYTGGSRISLNHCAHLDDVYNYKTIEFHVLGLEETTEFLPFQIQYLRSRVRIPDTIKIPDKYLMPQEFWRTINGAKKKRYSFPRCLYPTNPGGPGHDYIKRNFIDGHEPMELWNASPDQGGMLRQFIPGLLTDNPSVNPDEYAMTLSGLPPAHRDALLYGKWNSSVGSFYPEWDEARHVIDDFWPSPHWLRFRGFDWGTAEPFCVLWAVVSDGEPFRDHNNIQRWFPRGAIIIYNEWYGCSKDDPSKGLRFRNEDMALGILERSEINHRDVPTLTDSLPFQDRGGDTIATVFQKNGVILTRGDTSRVPGWSQLRSRLIGIQIDSNSEIRTPMIFICACCKYVREYIPALQAHPKVGHEEDAVEHGEATHSLDTLRLIAMAHIIVKDSPHVTQAKIDKEILRMSRPTMNKILKLAGHKPLK